MVIPAMNRMRDELQAIADNYKYSPAVRVAVKLGLGLLEKYDALIDDSEVYRIAIGTVSLFASCSCCTDVQLSPPPALQASLLREARME